MFVYDDVGGGDLFIGGVDWFTAVVSFPRWSLSRGGCECGNSVFIVLGFIMAQLGASATSSKFSNSTAVPFLVAVDIMLCNASVVFGPARLRSAVSRSCCAHAWRLSSGTMMDVRSRRTWYLAIIVLSDSLGFRLNFFSAAWQSVNVWS